MNQKKYMTLGIVGFFLLIAIIMFSNATFLTIDSGERGVLFRTFGDGLDKENIYQPGFHVVAPWNTMYVYEVREAQLEEEMEARDLWPPVYGKTGSPGSPLRSASGDR